MKSNFFFTKQLLCLLFLFCIISQSSSAQDLLKGNDLSSVKIDNISDADLSKFQAQLQASGMTMAQAEQLATQKGMTQSEFNKLKDRISRIGSSGTASAPVVMPDLGRQAQKTDYKTFQHTSIDGVFGSMLFTTPSLSFEPNLRIGVPSDYMLGPDDELVITVFGYQEANIRTQVSAEGSIQIPQVGSIMLNGLNFEEASKRIKDRMMRTAYPNMASGLTQVAITLGKIRSIHITVLGAVKPGNYTISSLTTLFNSLYQSGGPDAINSFRRIELLRSGKIIKIIDLYQLLLKGDQSGNVILKENDVINIPVYQKRATITGEVKRPGMFELIDGENMETLIGFAGGFTEKAFASVLKIKQFTEVDRRIKDLPRSSFSAYQPGNGDVIEVSAVLERLENSVTIAGAVYRPGDFELTQGLTVGQLIRKASGVTDDIFTGRAMISRTHDDQTKENISFNVTEVLKGGNADIPLRKNDVVTIASVREFKEEYKVRIEGEVRKPGEYPYKENLTLKDLLFSAGSFTEAGSPYRIEVARRINSNDTAHLADSLAEVFDINTDKDLALKSDAFVIKPFDIITVRRKPGYIEQQSVTIKGEILYPGRYTIQSKKERVSDLLRRSGGLTSSAFAPGVYLVRDYSYNRLLQEDKVNKAAIIGKNINDSSSLAIADVSTVNARIVINIEQISQHPGSKEDFFLEEGDVIDVPKLDPLVKISGEVFQSTKASFEMNASFQDYLTKAGGITSNARLSKSYVLYPNGEIDRTRSAFFGLFRHYPKITTGAEIVVPRRVEHRKLTAAETIGLTSAFLSLVSLLIVTISTLNR